MLNLDTHILILALAGELTQRERYLLSRHEWSISAIVLWEVAKLSQHKRIEVDLDSAELSRLLTRLYVWPLDLEVCRKVRELDFHSDPADEIIAATSLVHHLPLLTRDRTIRRSRKLAFA